MNTLVLCCAAALSAGPDTPSPSKVDDLFRTSTPAFATGVHIGDTVVRGQTPGPVPIYQDPNGIPPTYGGPQPLGDPFLGNAAPSVVDSIPGTAFPFGLYHLGQPRIGRANASWGILAESNLDGRPGDLQINELDVDFGYIVPVGGWGLRVTHEYGQRWWQGPPGGFGLASELYHFGMDFELATVPDGDPWGMVLAFSPSLNTDFETNLRSDAYNWDGRGYITYQHSPHLMLVGGVGYWDRVKDRVIPYAGVIWKPDNRWEIHATVPEAKISYCLGHGFGGCQWLYFRAEYHVEAYQVETSGAAKPVGGVTFRQTDKMEIQDYRLLLGYAFSNGAVDGFLEAGWVMGREVEFLSNTVSDFGVDDGFIGRVGIRF